MSAPMSPSAEAQRLEEDRQRIKNWKRWGPYLSERQWGTVREDYSPFGEAWDHFPHDHARSRAYRWGEDGLGGICDRHQYICFAVALWNGRDPILKERLFGLTGNEGNHGEDVKEYYFYLDSTPTHSYMKYLYKYPQSEYPYARLVEENRHRGRNALEFELVDTGVFDESRYFDVFIEYAKAAPEDILIRIQAINRGPDAAELHLLPTIWFRNTWSWGVEERKPRARAKDLKDAKVVEVHHHYYRHRWLLCDGAPELLFTENETNYWRLYGPENVSRYAKDGINDYIVHGTKEQLILLLREWYMHPNGQLPAYEWAFGDVNPPVHAWAAWRVYKVEKKRRGKGDRQFLESVFHKLLLNFTWWVNRKDAEGRNVFQGGFLGLDNIGVFDRSAPLPMGGHIEQSDGTSWMAMYCLNMLAIALELARENPAYEGVASKFWEHFVYIAYAMNNLGGEGIELWDAQDGFYYDVLHLPDGQHFFLKVRSMVGLIPLFAVETLDPELLDRLPGFKQRLEWFIDNRPDLNQNCACMRTPGHSSRRLLSIVDPDRLRRVLRYMLDEEEFFSPYGIRALSRHHLKHPYTLWVNGAEHRVDYEPAESSTSLFGGNSNWRGPIWFPVNFLLIESLQKFHFYLGDAYKVECPTGSGKMMTLWEVAGEISQRLTRIFLRGPDGRRPVFGGAEKLQNDPHWRDLIPFHEYFHGDNGAGIGASHQTGWTALIAKLIQQYGA